MKRTLIELPAVTPDGVFLAHYSEKGLAELDFPKNGRGAKRAVSAEPIPLQIIRWHRLTLSALKAMLAGRDPRELPPLDWSGKTEFQKSVWRALLKISAGQTKSYGEVAQAISNPRAVRAVGGACGANPIPVLVPCHRVLAASHKIGGYTSGPEWKRRLLGRDGITL